MISIKSIISNSSGRSISKSNYYYILINIGLSAFSFIRSFVFMKVLDMKELGTISLIQTIFMFIGMLQMGLFNVGFRIISLGKEVEIERTNNTIYTYLLILLPLGILFCIFSVKFSWISDLSFILLLISVVFGVMTLLNTWCHNMLIGEQKLDEVNIANIVSYTLSLILLPFAFYYGFWGAMVVIMIQPLIFVTLSVYRNSELRPTRLDFNLKYIRYILSFGFIPFLGGIFAAIYTQVERWSITDVLGVEALGGFYLVFLYVSLYQLVPTSINAIFFPKAVKAYSDGLYDDFKQYVKYYYVTLIGYGILIVLVTITLLRPVISVIFPNHLIGVQYVYYILPGLVLQSLIEPIGLILNSAVILRPILVISAVNLLFNVTVIAFMVSVGLFSLDNVAILRSCSGIVLVVGYAITYSIIKRRLYPIKA